MEETQKTTGSTNAPNQSRRKATTGKKGTKVKTKIDAKSLKEAEARSSKTIEKKVVEAITTKRHQRMADKAKTRASAPAAVVIPEVEAVKITDVSGIVYEKADYDAMVEMYDSTIKDIKEGEIVAGKVVGVTQEDVIVDVGFKSEGIIPMGEFSQPINIAVGDDIEVFLEQIEDSKGQLLLSKQKADFMRVWDRIRDIHDAGDNVEGRVARRIKGGVVVDVMGVDAFLPGSQISLRQVPDFDALIGQMMEVKIIKLNKARRNIVVSRRVVLEVERESLRSSLLAEIEVGQIRQGVVKNITDFGVFIDLGGVDGLLHITDMSWGRIRHPSELANLGETIDIKILDFDDKTSRISLGLKQMTPYPWENIEQKYPIGKKVEGRVVSITDYGAFVELEKGIEGLIHISEMSWTQHIKHPSKIMNAGDSVDAVVLSVDKENEKISLGIKQMEPDPWLTIEGKYPVGAVVTGTVRNLTAFGAFVELEEGIDGLVHISDMSWTRRIQHPSEAMKKGDKVEVKVIRIDHENRRISLGYKQLQVDPWPEIAKKFAAGAECLGTVVRVMDRGVVVDLDGDVEGFVPSAQLGDKDMTDPTGIFKEGESLPLVVMEIDRSQHKIVLSAVAYYKQRDASEFNEYLAKHQAQVVETDSAMADAMPEALKAKVVEEAPPKAAAKEAAPAVETEAAPKAEAEAEPAEAAPAEETPAEEAAPETEAAPEADADSSDEKKEEKEE